ncbi:ATP-dependent RNA helicase mrh4, mitochondrial [Smittium culicis]|uniref:ATP-dependent RNA helicase mrh4, mitochondrial n=1 Tax=Smittium culicis TaxID=133412 RepID=A0A1R1Y0I1_9FUNG|nr:ATP-dependent RNA helicase mrh4, mitochondrial [Smittium culicis]
MFNQSLLSSIKNPFALKFNSTILSSIQYSIAANTVNNAKKYYSQSSNRQSSLKSRRSNNPSTFKRFDNSKRINSRSAIPTTKAAIDPVDKRYSIAKAQKKKYEDLKKMKVPGIGHTPVRFQLYPIENEAKTDLISIIKRSNDGATKKAIDMSEIKQALTQADFDNLGLLPSVSNAAKCLISSRLSSAAHSQSSNIHPTPIQALSIPEILNLQSINKKKSLKDIPITNPIPSTAKNSPETPIDQLGVVNSVFLAAETGSGKTLAYLLPVISMLKKEESTILKLSKSSPLTPSKTPSFDNSIKEFNALASNQSSESDPALLQNSSVENGSAVESDTQISPINMFKERRPRAIIIVPTLELAHQTIKICKSLSHSIKYRAVLIDFKKGLKKVYQDFDNSPVDLVVGTPASLRRAFYKGQILSYSNTQHIVIDEADSIMDEQGHLEDTMHILKQARLNNSSKPNAKPENIIFVSATLPKAVLQRIVFNYPSITNISTPKLHQINPKIRTNKIDVPKMFQGSKISAIKEVIRNNNNDKRFMVFCNTVSTASELHKKLLELNYPVSLLVGNIKSAGKKNYKQSEINSELPSNKENVKNRLLTLHNFNSTSDTINGTENDSSSDHDAVPLLSDNLSNDTNKKILICTDLGSRGIDTLVVDHVIMYDFPTTAINYLHRCGRTGRMGTTGKVTTLVSKNDRRNQQKIDMFIRSGIVVG